MGLFGFFLWKNWRALGRDVEDDQPMAGSYWFMMWTQHVSQVSRRLRQERRDNRDELQISG